MSGPADGSRADIVRSPRGGILRAARRPPGFVVRGPRPRVPADPGPLWPGPSEDLCWLAGDFRILQRTDGHRFSLDDLMVAHTAAEELAAAPPRRLLDLGCGIGTVLLFLAWRFPEATGLGVEAQAISADLARRSIAWNGVDDRCRVVCGDFRETAPLDGAGAFELVTGTPPYFPPGTGLESPNVQRAPCRFEHRGGIEAYVERAATVLAPGAPFVVCQAWLERDRVAPAAAAHGLVVERRQAIVPRAGKEPLLETYVMRHAAYASTPRICEPLVVRDANGQRTAAFSSVRLAMGMPP